MTAPFAVEAQHSQLLPSNPLGQRLCEIFSYRWHTISGTNASDPRWKTRTKYPLRPRVLWQRWNDPNVLVGVRFGSTTTYALIDIDCTSTYHPATNPAGLPLILAALETIGIVRHLLLTSSSSGGLHLYLPLPHAVPSFGLAQALKQCLAAQEIEIAAGQVELFPNTKSYAIPGTYTEYNAHRLPLQPDSGSHLLDADHNSIGNDLGQFFRYWDTAAAGQDLETLHEAIAVARRNSSKRKRHRIAVVDEWRSDLQTEINDGWTGHGQTNHLLKTIACYGVVFERLTGEALAEFVQSTAINAPGYETYCRHQHEIGQRSRLWARSAEKYWWALGSEPQRSSNPFRGDGSDDSPNSRINQNQVRATEAQRRIQEAYMRLESNGQLPSDITSRIRLLIQEARTSVQTLYRYREIWHPEHQPPDSSTGSVIAAAAGDSSDTTAVKSNPVKPPETRQSRKLHTLGNNMKCRGIFGFSFASNGSVSEGAIEVVLEFGLKDREENQFNEDPLENLDPDD
ncbi:hypothetical protein [Leptolyngbya sp. GGD]|uniref:hypothetical protein n=1 Tax=Leptolyngbya sp. GGD TaxID=2997907 RepID=UPI00227AA1F1|nr:hypothetical protein [Leptolyngbya sp. GGD]MCY6494577.1 hypothetical protein [Leptolyngbya sp. GGD]